MRADLPTPQVGERAGITMIRAAVMAAVFLSALFQSLPGSGQTLVGGPGQVSPPAPASLPSVTEDVTTKNQPLSHEGGGAPSEVPLIPGTSAARTWKIQGKVVSLEGELLPGAAVWVASFPLPSRPLAETRADSYGAFSLAVPAEAQNSHPHALVLGASQPGYLETREPVEFDDPPGVWKTTLLLRSAAESYDEPSLDSLDAWLLPRLKPSRVCSQNAEFPCKDFEAALARYRRQPRDAAVLQQVLEATRNSKFPQARLLASLAMMRMGAWAGAEKILALATPESQGLPESLLVQGIRWNLLRRPDEAVQALQRAQQALPRSNLVQLELGRAAFLAEDWTTAEERLRVALADRALAPHARYLRTRTFVAQGYLEAASRELKELLKSMKRKPLPPPVQSFVADFEERLEKHSAQPISSVMTQPVPELMQSVLALGGLDPSSPPSPEELAELLKQAGTRAERFFRDFSNTAATEVLRQTQLDKKGKPRGTRNEEFYYVFLNRAEHGRFWMEEYRGNQQGRPSGVGGLDAGYMATSGFASSLIVLHPKWQPGMAFRFLGRQQVGGRPAYVIGFAQRPEISPPLGTFRVAQRKVAMLHLQGIAWISADQHQVLRLRTDLLRSSSEIQLRRETTEIDYRAYRFQTSPLSFWLPNRVTVSVDWAGKRLRNEHIFSKFRLFKVDAEDVGGSQEVTAEATGKSPSDR